MDNPRPWMEIIKGPFNPIYITNGVWRRRGGGAGAEEGGCEGSSYDICNLVASIVSKTDIPVDVADRDLPPSHLAACEFHDSIDKPGSPKIV